MLITAASLAILVYGMVAALLGAILPGLSRRFLLTPRQNGNVALFQAVGLMIGSLCAGPIMDVQGKQVGMLAGLGLVALALLRLRGAGSYRGIGAAMWLLGAGGGVVVAAANSLSPDIDPVHPEVVSNRLNLFFALGGLLTPLIGAKLFRGNPRGLPLFAAVLAIAALLAGVAAPFPPPAGEVSFRISSAGALLTDTRLLGLAFLLFLYVACEAGVWNWLVRHMVAQGVAESKALTILSLGFGLGLLSGRVAAIQILTHVDARAVLAGSSALMAITTFAMLRTVAPGMAQVAVFLAGVAMAPVYPTVLGLVGGTFHGETGATAVGIAVTFGWFGLAVSSPIIGGIAGGDPRGFKKALLLLPFASVVMTAVAFVL